MNNKILLIPLVGIMITLGYFFIQSKPCGATCNMKPIDLNVADFKQQLLEDDVIILDVRTPQEFATGHIANALNIDFNNQPKFEEEISKLDKTKSYLIYCRSGNRSKQAVDRMSTLGFQNLTNLVGGIISWQASNYPLTQNN